MDNVQTQLYYDTHKKSGWFAAILNMIIPGAGYMYCGNILLGILVLILFIVISIVTLGYGSVVIYAIIFIDGFLGASRFNKKLVKKIMKQDII